MKTFHKIIEIVVSLLITNIMITSKFLFAYTECKQLFDRYL